MINDIKFQAATGRNERHEDTGKLFCQ